MTKQEKAMILEGAKTAFFEAMLDGFAGGENRKSTKTKNAHGYTTISYITEDGKFAVVDRYCTNQFSDFSAGTTTIFIEDEGGKGLWLPIWWMSYGGKYPERAIPFLKEALKKAHGRKLFLGGRGLARVNDDSHLTNNLKFKLTYTNNYNGDFSSFDGTENIFQNPLIGFDPEKIGYHQYFGMSLL